MKKLCHGAINLTASSKYKVDNHTWVTFRLGEFYLNYAEAVFKYLGSADATSAEFPMSAREGSLVKLVCACKECHNSLLVWAMMLSGQNMQ